MAEAEKMAKGGGGLFGMFGGADYGGAVEKYKQAANQLYVSVSKFCFSFVLSLDSDCCISVLVSAVGGDDDSNEA